MSKQSIEERNERMALMHSQGCTLQAIGNQFGITRERVRQILAKRGVKASDGGISVKTTIKKQQLQARRESASLKKYGLPYDLMCELREQGLVSAFTRQRLNSEMRGIDWNLTFAQWFAVWQTSGKLHLRGRGKGRYVMSRILDDGPYALGNVHIQLAVENSREAVEKWRGKTKENRGVFLLFPGRDLAWCARVWKVSVGFFATEEDAVIARDQYIRENKCAVRKTKGYGVDLRGKCVRYQVSMDRRHIGMFDTPREAVLARNKYIKDHGLSNPILEVPDASEPLTVTEYQEAQSEATHA